MATEPIISPWIIYAVSTIGKIRDASAFLAVVSSIILIFAAIFRALEDTDYDEKKIESLNRAIKYSSIAVIVFGVGAIIIPGDKLLMAMVVAQYITPDNIQLVQGNIVDFVSEITQAIKK